MNENLKNKVISAAYGSAGIFDRISVWIAVWKDPECRKLYEEYKSTADAVHNIQIEECPDEVIDNVVNMTVGKEESHEDNEQTGFFRNPAFAAIAGLILLAAAIYTFDARKQQQKEELAQKYTQEEVLQAEREVKESLAIVSRIFTKTSKKLEEEIIPQNVSKPLNQGFEIINQLFSKGEKNDENS